MQQHQRSLFTILAAAMSLVLAIGTPRIAPAANCPFCPAVGNTLTEDFNVAKVAIFAERVAAKIPKSSSGEESPDESLRLGIFRITEVIKGSELLGETKEIEVLFRENPDEPNRYLMFGSGEPLLWTTPLAMTEAEATYFRGLPQMPEKGADRIAAFFPYLEHPDRLIADDTYSEFARAPYADVKAIKHLLKSEHLKTRLSDPKLSLNHRRLYATMLGVCGDKHDAPFIAERITSTSREFRAGLDAMIGCYLTLLGEEGLPLVDEQFFRNPNAEYTDIYAALMAIRFHSDEKTISQDRLVQSIKLLLDKPELADLVIPDLARWKVWNLLPEMEKLFLEAGNTSTWVRVPVIRYLRDNPLPEAADLIEKLRKLDPENVERAETLFPKNSFAIDESKPAEIAPTPELPSNTQKKNEEPTEIVEPLPSDAEAPFIAAQEVDGDSPPATEVADPSQGKQPETPVAAPSSTLRTTIITIAAIALAVLGIALFPRGQTAK